MRSIIFSLAAFSLIACVAVNQPTPYGTGADDSNTVNSLSNLNPALTTYGGSSYAGQLYNSLSAEDANRWSEQGAPFQNWVSVIANAGACLGTTGASLTMTPTACVAYNAGYRGTETGPITFPNGSTCWIAMDENTNGNNANLPNFTRVPNEHYLIDCIDATQPAMAPDSQILMKVVTLGGAITTVTDLRTKTAINFTSSVTLAGDANGPSGSNQVTSTHLASALPTAQGGSGIQSPTARDIMITEGSSAFNLLNLGADTLLQGQGSSLDPVAVAVPNVPTDGAHALTYSTSTHLFSNTALSSVIGTHGQQLFTNSGTFTVPANVYSVTFECWGPGGGGGGYGAAATNGSNGSANTTVKIGSTNYCEGDAGSGGLGANAGVVGVGGLGAGGSHGVLNLGGGNGFFGNVQCGQVTLGGCGGSPARGDTSGNSGAISYGGAGSGDGLGLHGAGGGGAGGYSENQVTTTPSTAFTVVIGAGGAAGTGGTGNGSAGGTGAVLVTW